MMADSLDPLPEAGNTFPKLGTTILMQPGVHVFNKSSCNRSNKEFERKPFVVHISVGRREYHWLLKCIRRLPCGHSSSNILEIQGCTNCQSVIQELFSIIKIW